jgi:hypothetical protein
VFIGSGKAGDVGVGCGRSRRLSGRDGIQEDMAGAAAISSVFIGSVEAGTWAPAALGGALAGGGEHV